jgi:hypothetical protein
MRRFSMTAVVIAAALACSGIAFGAERSWIVQAGGGSTNPSQSSRLLSGRIACLAVAHLARPWLLLGGELNWSDVPASRMHSIPEVRVSEDNTRAIALSVTMRVQAPVRAGLAPFGVAETGYSRIRSGDVHVYDLGFGFPGGLTPGRVDWGTRAAIGVGLRAVLPGAWPDPEASIREVSLGMKHRQNFAEMRYSLAW